METRFKVVVTNFITDSLEPERQVLGEMAEVEALGAKVEDDLIGKVENADAVMIYHNLTISQKTIRRLSRYKIMVRCGGHWSQE